MTTHIDTLKEWWSEAEEGVIEKGDTVINWFGGETTVYVAAERARRQNPHTRILARAPKPKPAWHDAVAVLANHRDYPDEERTVWTRELDPEQYDWADPNGQFVAPHHLVNVTPLIEAKVTDEMRARAIAAYEDDHGSFAARIDATLAAALGIEAE